MNVDAELDAWRREWQTDNAVPADLRRKVERQSRWMKIALAADILVTVSIGGGALWFALRSPRPPYILLAAATWLFIGAAWTFSLSVNRGNWAPASIDTAAFVELSIRRCRARLAAVWFGAALFLSETAFCLGWIYRQMPEPRKPLWQWLRFGSTAIDVVWPAAVLFGVFLFLYRRHKLAELAYLRNLHGEIGGGPAADAN